MMEKKFWDAYVKKNSPRSGAFLQSWNWGEFQESVGKEVRRVRPGVQLIKMPLPAGQFYWYCPRGPIGGSIPPLDAIFLRHEPDIGVEPVGKKVKDVQPANTLILDLRQDEDALLAHMHPKTRYNISLAQKKGVTVEMIPPRSDSGVEVLRKIWPLFAQTAGRGQFRLHPREYYEKMLTIANLSVARYADAEVAVAITIDFAGTRTYLHGASSNEHRNLMAPFLLHWELIRDAKQKGLTAYDWWGVAPKDAGPDHPWAGITRFKLSFGGERVEYPGTFDYILQPSRYRLYAFLCRLRK